MDKKLLNRFIANKCTSTEVDAILGWVQGQTDKSQEESLFKNIWDKIELLDDTNSDHVRLRLDKIHHTININQSEREFTRNKRFLTIPKGYFTQWVSRVAVVLLIPVITLFMYTRFFQSEQFYAQDINQKIEIISPSGARTFFELSDGTKVWLNHDSKMIYPSTFSGNVRIVKLFGEGYFEVAPNKAKPFIVESNGMAVTAVGTSFNVRAYNDGSDFETTLESGKVIIQKSIRDKKSGTINMKPGQHFAFNTSTDQYTLKTEELTKYVSWKEGKLIFKDDHLDRVAEQLSRWFDVEIVINDIKLKELTCTGTFVNETLSQVLEMLELVTPISYTISERKIMPDGTYSKNEIIIYKKERKETDRN
jgi:ferric-dicitrate binding protein FerR (iron transport regulator)